MQDLSCRKFSDLLDDNINYQMTPSDGTYEGFYRFAERHRDVIQKFGRFPHRNKILGRTSSEQEQEYLRYAGQWVLRRVGSARLERLHYHQNNNGHQKQYWHLIKYAKVDMGFLAAILSQLLHMPEAHMMIAN